MHDVVKYKLYSIYEPIVLPQNSHRATFRIEFNHQDDEASERSGSSHSTESSILVHRSEDNPDSTPEDQEGKDTQMQVYIQL